MLKIILRTYGLLIGTLGICIIPTYPFPQLSAFFFAFVHLWIDLAMISYGIAGSAVWFLQPPELYSRLLRR